MDLYKTVLKTISTAENQNMVHWVNTGTIDSNIEKKDGFSSSPKEILGQIYSSLSTYDSVKLAATNKYMRAAFFSWALQPGYKRGLAQELADYEANLKGVFWFTSKLSTLFSSSQELTDQEIYNTLQGCVKSKLLVCSKEGLARLKLKKLDSPLILQKIASGEFTEEELLFKRDSLCKEIQERRQAPIADQARENLQLEGVQICLLVDLLTMTEAENLYPWVAKCLDSVHLQAGLADGQILKHDLTASRDIGALELSESSEQEFSRFLFHSNTHFALNMVQVDRALRAKQITITEVLQFPSQVVMLAENKMISDDVFHPDKTKRTITKEDVFAVDGYHAMAMNTIHMKCFIASGRRTLAEVVRWKRDSPEVKALTLNWVEDVMVEANVEKVSPNDIALLMEQAISKANLLIRIEEAHQPWGQYYFRNVWGNRLTAKTCITAGTEAIEALLLKGIDQKIAFLVQKKLITVEELVKLTPQQIIMLSNQSVQWAFENGHLTGSNVSNLSDDQMLEIALSRRGEHDHKPAGNCTIQ